MPGRGRKRTGNIWARLVQVPRSEEVCAARWTSTHPSGGRTLSTLMVCAVFLFASCAVGHLGQQAFTLSTSGSYRGGGWVQREVRLSLPLTTTRARTLGPPQGSVVWAAVPSWGAVGRQAAPGPAAGCVCDLASAAIKWVQASHLPPWGAGTSKWMSPDSHRSGAVGGPVHIRGTQPVMTQQGRTGQRQRSGRRHGASQGPEQEVKGGLKGAENKRGCLAGPVEPTEGCAHPL